MADEQHLEKLRQGVDAWNAWREQHPELRWLDLRGADLRGITNLSKPGKRINLGSTMLSNAILAKTDLCNADLIGSELIGAYLYETKLCGANLRGAKLWTATMVKTNLAGADLTDCDVYGASIWDLKLEVAKQEDIIITLPSQPVITVGNLEVAQFIYLLLHNEKIREVIDTITSKVVLILGRFTEERKAVLDALRDELRRRDYLPVLFDFETPANMDLTGTVSTLARLARFIIADLTDPSCIPHELCAIVPHVRHVPVQPILLEDKRVYTMFEDLMAYPWVLGIYHYATPELLIANLSERVVGPAEAKALELRAKRTLG